MEAGAGPVAGVADAGGGLPLPRHGVDRGDEPGVDSSVGLHPRGRLVARQVAAARAVVHPRH